jgi:nitrogen fixation NifU-like protein
MSELRDLYQEVILDHNRRPRNFGPLEGANRKADGYNPLCGDKITIYLRVKGGVIDGVSFQGAGLISKASASMMTDAIREDLAEVEALFESHRMVTVTSTAPGRREAGCWPPSPGCGSSRVSSAPAWLAHAARRSRKQTSRSRRRRGALSRNESRAMSNESHGRARL